MLRAHLATFPPRKDVMCAAIGSIAPQVDRVFLCLNEYSEIPSELKEFKNLEAVIPPRNLKDAGKFAFPAADDDIIFTIDDDIVYPPDYVERFLAVSEKISLENNTLGYHGHAWVYKKRFKSHGWRNFLFAKECRKTFKVDVLGTGTVCVLGKNLPILDQISTSAGFVDYRFARLQTGRGINLWSLPRPEGYLVHNLPDELWESSLFKTVNLKGLPEMQTELNKLMSELSHGSGETWETLSRSSGQLK